MAGSVLAAIALTGCTLVPSHSAPTPPAGVPAVPVPDPVLVTHVQPETIEPTPTIEPSTTETETATATPTPATPTTEAPAKVIYLTFDDGPTREWTPEVLRILKERGATATFFVLGLQAEKSPDQVALVSYQGHAVASHTYRHLDLPKQKRSTIDKEIETTSDLLGNIDRCVRPPYGSTNSTVRKAITDRDKVQVLWDVDTEDWRRPGADAIVENVLANAKPGSVVLMHDGGGDRSQTLAALPRFMDELSAQGYTFEAIPECLPTG